MRWLELKAKEQGYQVNISNVTEKEGCLGIAGPKSREVMKRLVNMDVSNESWKFMEAKDVQIDGVNVRALRISYTGELGWELYMDINDTVKVYNKILEAGEEYGIDNFGSFAMNSLRLDKGFRAWGLEVGISRIY